MSGFSSGATPDVARARPQVVGGPAVLATFLWRLTIAFCGFWGWWLYGHDFDELIFLTQSGNLLTSLVFAGVAVQGLVVGLSFGREASTHVLRGAMTLLLLVVGSTYLGVIGGDTAEAKDFFTHVVTPLLVLADWCFVGRSQNRTRWWQPLIWLILPTVWLIWYHATEGFSDRSTWGSPIYDFLDPRDSSYPGVIAGLLSGTIAAAYLLYGIAKIKAAVARQAGGGYAGPPTAPPGGHPPQYGQPGHFPPPTPVQYPPQRGVAAPYAQQRPPPYPPPRPPYPPQSP